MDATRDFSTTMRIDLHPLQPTDGRVRKRRASRTRRLPAEDKTAASGSADYNRLLESVYDAVLVTDADGRITDYNQRAVEFFACAAQELPGASLLHFISGATRELLDAIWRNLEQHRYTLIEAYCARRDGSLFPAEIAVNRLDLSTDRRLSFFIRDVTVRKQAEREREDAVARLEEHDRARSQFVANVSHELRTPLTSMIYAVSNLLRGIAGPLSPRTREYMEMLDGDCKRLLGTVNDILDLRRIEGRNLTLSRSRVPFGRLVQRGVEALRVQARQKHIAVELDTDSRHGFVDCDVPKMERVIVNILGNAVKFTPEHGRIRVAVRADPASEGRVQVTIEDTGIGIPPQELDKVTIRYHTVGRQPTGCGLGLAISKEIVDLHGGSLSILSPVPGRSDGTVVRVSLPLVDPGRVLAVSPDQGFGVRLQAALSPHGYRLGVAADVGTAAHSMVADGADVVVLDFGGENDTARDVLLKMKSDRRMMRIPVVALVPDGTSGETAAVLRSFSVAVIPGSSADGALLDAVGGLFFARLGADPALVLPAGVPTERDGASR